MRRLIAILAVVVSSGCHSAAYQVATYQNNHDFKIARFRETCGTPAKCSDAPSCEARCLALNHEEKALHEAAAALKNGGALPLQLKALKQAEKAAP